MGILTSQIATQLRAVHSGNGWSATGLKQHVEGLTLSQATTQVHSANSIATLVQHTHYYLVVSINYLRTGKLEGKDALSFDLPPLHNQQDWNTFIEKVFAAAEELATLVEQLPDERLSDTFGDEKYGTYFRNIEGIIEHLYYHIGQISILRKSLPN